MRPRVAPAKAAQRGFALIAILSLAALVSAFLIANTLANIGSRPERDKRNVEVLQKAKAALIAYAASTEGWQAMMGQANKQPGALPCPAILNDTGTADCVGAGISPSTSLIGRLPWQTMGIEDLRDASGEQLWYALSRSFRKDFGTTIINSDTQGQLTVTGPSPASQVVAVVFAPGRALDLSPAGGPVQGRPNNAWQNYLESFNPNDNVNFLIANNATPSASYNDQMLIVTQAEIMAAVEPVVAARIERDLRPLFSQFAADWSGAYPFPQAFPVTGSPPATPSTYVGSVTTPATTRGLVPLSTTPTFGWGGVSVIQIPGGTGSSTVTGVSCSTSGNPPTVFCQIDYSGSSDDRPDIRLSVSISGQPGRVLAKPQPAPPTYSVAMTNHDGNPLFDNGPPTYGQWSAVGSFPPQAGYVLDGSGNGEFVYIGRLQNANTTENRVHLTFTLPNPPSYSPSLTNTTVPPLDWYIANEWYRQTYYAISPGFAPGAGSACGAGPACLTVKSPPPQFQPPSADKTNVQALFVLAGRAMTGNPRPSVSATLADYFEQDNLSAANGTLPNVYRNRVGPPTSINDRVVIVAPPAP